MNLASFSSNFLFVCSIVSQITHSFLNGFQHFSHVCPTRHTKTIVGLSFLKLNFKGLFAIIIVC